MLRHAAGMPSTPSALTWLLTMKTCRKSPLMLLRLMFITLVPVLEAQNIEVQPEVTGYVEHDVTLPCRFIPGSKEANITQAQWTLKTPAGEDMIIIVNSPVFGNDVHDTFLKDRVNSDGQSLIIRDVKLGDAGLYTCSVATFPSGSFEGTTKFIVHAAVIIRGRFCHCSCCLVDAGDRGSCSLCYLHQKIQFLHQAPCPHWYKSLFEGRDQAVCDRQTGGCGVLWREAHTTPRCSTFIQQQTNRDAVYRWCHLLWCHSFAAAAQMRWHLCYSDRALFLVLAESSCMQVIFTITLVSVIEICTSVHSTGPEKNTSCSHVRHEHVSGRINSLTAGDTQGTIVIRWITELAEL